MFSPLNYKLRPCPDRVPTDKFQCKKRGDLCCHNHSQEEKNRAIKALRTPPKILPEHESMQDYIDIIDEMELLNNKQNDNIEVIPPANEPPISKTTSVSSPSPINPTPTVKKAVLAKLPEENHDKWKALEHSMNKESIDNEK